MEQQNYELHFSPLQGYTDHIFRNAFAKYFGGIDVYYTPFIRVEKGEVRRRDSRGIRPDLNTMTNPVPQILPGSPEEFRMLVRLLQENGYRRVDINLGCPFPLIAGKQKGAGMLPYPERVEEVLRPIEEFPEIQFSLKIRLGWENAGECLLLAPVFNNLRLCHVTVHARTGKQQYKGDTQPEAFNEFYQVCRHPLFYNGDLHTPDDIRNILEKFPLLRGVSMGRGLLYSPFVAKEFKENETFPEDLRISTLKSFHSELFNAYSDVLQGEIQLLMKMKTLWEYFLPEADHKLRKRIKKANRLSQYTESAKAIFTV